MNIIKLVKGILMALDIARFKRLFDRAKAAIVENLELKAAVADLSAQLADALSNDVADARAIQTAQAEAAIASEAAEVAKAALAPLQAAVDADASEDEQINALLDSVDDDEEEDDGGEQ
jgi:Lon protease-like protein